MKKILTILALTLLCARALACTTAIVSAGASGSGRPLLFKQRDTSNPYNVVVNIPSTDGKYAYTAVFNASDKTRRSVYAGSNEKGFAIVNNMSYNIAEGDYDADNGSVMRRALECCASVDEFEAMLLAEESRECASNFAVTDAGGAAAYIEAADASVTRYDVPEGGWLVRSNYSVSGREDEPSGYARYETAHSIMSSHKGKFTVSDLIDGLGRSWYNAVLGFDASRKFRRGLIYDEDFIPRPTTVSAVCFDGPSVMWTAVGYTPACFAVPVEVLGEIPVCVGPTDPEGRAPASVLAEKLKAEMHPLPRDAARKYVDFRVVRPIMKTVRRYEKTAAGLLGRPDEIDALFEEFKKQF